MALGYTGVELLRLLSQHPQVSCRPSRRARKPVCPFADMYPNLRVMSIWLFVTPDDARLTGAMWSFCDPMGWPWLQARELLAAGVKVIDRLLTSASKTWPI